MNIDEIRKLSQDVSSLLSRLNRQKHQVSNVVEQNFSYSNTLIEKLEEKTKNRLNQIDAMFKLKMQELTDKMRL